VGAADLEAQARENPLGGRDFGDLVNRKIDVA
jgi:hypothetical protein